MNKTTQSLTKEPNMTLEQAQDLLNKASLESTTSYNWPTGPANKILGYLVVTEYNLGMAVVQRQN